MKRELVYMDATSRKFWNIELCGNSHTVTYGRIGTSGQTATKSFSSEDAARKDMEKLIMRSLATPVLVNSPLLQRIETLDLSLGVLTDEGAKALLQLPASPTLKRLNLHYNYVGTDLARQLKALPLTVDVSKPSEMEEEDEWRFVAVGESGWALKMIAAFPARLSGETFGCRGVPRLGIIGNPENRRVRNFQAALEALGHPRPSCLSYAEILSDPATLDRFDVDRLRIDSPGENEATSG